jgi:excisionase family DNA binding protein
MRELDDVLSLNEAASRAEVSSARLRQLIDERRLRAKKIGNSWAILAADLDTFLGKPRVAGRPDERKAIESRLRVELRPVSPIQISLLPYNQEIRLWFRVDNRTDQEVELDRMLVEVWYPHPVAEGAILDRYAIAPNQSIESPMFHAWPSSDKVEMMRSAAVDRTQYSELQIYVRAYFDTNVGTVPVMTRITKAKGEFPIQLPPPPPTFDEQTR